MNRYIKWLLPLVILIPIAPFTPTIDLAISRYFFQHGHFLENSFTAFMFRYGERLGFVFGILAALIFYLSYVKKRFKPFRHLTLTIGLTLFLGAGVLINLTFKEYWGRPRPRQLKEFGGQHDYHAFYQPNFSAKVPLKSFPSGHVAMGFSYLALCYGAYKERMRIPFYVGILLTLLFGGGLFYGRLAQGGHFFSDALFSILIMWYTTLISWITSGFLLKHLEDQGVFGRCLTFPQRLLGWGKQESLSPSVQGKSDRERLL